VPHKKKMLNNQKNKSNYKNSSKPQIRENKGFNDLIAVIILKKKFFFKIKAIYE